MSKDTETIDFAEVERLALAHRPKLIVCGGSAYPREIDAEIPRDSDKAGSLLMFDIAHIAGLVAAKLTKTHSISDFVTTTHKTLRGGA